MQRRTIDIHHHYVPERVVGEAKRHGKALGIEVSEDNNGTIRFSSMAVRGIRCCMA
jgi:hypothetical protein